VATWSATSPTTPVPPGGSASRTHATSGTAHRGEHITDARTGDRPGTVASVTVLADDLTWADIDATAAFAMGEGALTWLRARPGRRGVVVWRDGSRDVFG